MELCCLSYSQMILARTSIFYPNNALRIRADHPAQSYLWSFGLTYAIIPVEVLTIHGVMPVGAQSFLPFLPLFLRRTTAIGVRTAEPPSPGQGARQASSNLQNDAWIALFDFSIAFPAVVVRWMLYVV